VTSLSSKGTFVHQFRRHISPRVNYSYCVLLKTNVGHIGIIFFLVLIPTISLYQIAFNQHHSRRNYDVISILEIAAVSAWFYVLLPIGWGCSLQKVNGQSLSINRMSSGNLNHGWGISNSGLEKNEGLPYCNSTSGFDFDHIIVIGITFRIAVPNFIHVLPPAAEFLMSWIFKITATAAQFYFQFHIGRRRCLENVKISQQTNFLRITQSIAAT